jgi:hypothetical protein
MGEKTDFGFSRTRTTKVAASATRAEPKMTVFRWDSLLVVFLQEGRGRTNPLGAENDFSLYTLHKKRPFLFG